jgi:hypothetical protein
MLDFVLVVLVIVLTAVTVLYGGGCELLMRSDSTRDTAIDEQEQAGSYGSS